MNIDLQKRAEIALGSLSADQRRSVTRSLSRLGAMGPSDLISSNLLKKLRQGGTGNLYISRLGQDLRAVISIDADRGLVIQDIVPHDRVKHLIDAIAPQ